MSTSTLESSDSAMSAAAQAAYKRRWFALLLLSLSLTIIIIDSTIVNIAFPSIRKTFNASFADAEWVNSIYSLVFGAALITWGKLGDQYGRRIIFVLGAVVFVVGSLGTGLSPSIGWLIGFRAMQGMGAAMMSPSTLSIISSTFKGKERGVAFGVWGATAGVAAALGPILGGWLITYGGQITADSWRLAFLINVPIGVIAIAGSFWAIRESRDTSIKHHIDFLGIFLASLALGSFVFATIEGQNYGWLTAGKVFTIGPISYPVLASGVTAIPAETPSFIPFLFVFGLIIFAIFVMVELWEERHGVEPLFEFGILQHRSFRYGLLTILIVALGEFGMVLVLSIYFQLANDLDAFQTGLRFLPFAICVMIAAPAAGVLSSRFGAKWVVTAGMLCEASAVFWLSQTLRVDTPYTALIAPFLLYGVGVGLAIAQLANIVLSDIPVEKAGIASGATNTVRQIGASLGIAIIGAVLFGQFTSTAKPLVQASTAFDEFGTNVANDTSLSAPSHAFGKLISASSDLIKQQIQTSLDANEGFDPGQNMVDLALAEAPKPLLLLYGINANDPKVVAQMKQELKPYADKLTGELIYALGTGFSTAADSSALIASIFVACGALCSLMIPNVRHAAIPGEAVAMAH